MDKVEFALDTLNLTLEQKMQLLQQLEAAVAHLASQIKREYKQVKQAQKSGA